MKHWQVFEDDEKIKHFLEVIGELSNSVVDQEEEELIEEQPNAWEENIVGHRVLHLKGNAIPQGLVTMERILKSNYMYSKLAK